MNIGKPVRVYTIPDPHRREIRRFDWKENPHLNPVRRDDEPIPAPNWPTKVPEKVPQDAQSPLLAF